MRNARARIISAAVAASAAVTAVALAAIPAASHIAATGAPGIFYHA